MRPFLSTMMLASTALQSDNTAEGGQFVHSNTSESETAWIVPAGVYRISILTVGAGGNSQFKVAAGAAAESGGGGDLRYVNDVPVTPGETLLVRACTNTRAVGLAGPSSYVARSNGTVIVKARGGNGKAGSPNAEASSGEGGGNGGLGTFGDSATNAPGGGGAGGYTGNGGAGGQLAAGGFTGQGGGGGGGHGGATQGWSGGGVGIYGEGPSGAAVGSTSTGGGSGGGNGVLCPAGAGGAPIAPIYGAGAGGYDSTTAYWQRGGAGVVRIVWGKGPNNGGRAFPSTLVSTREGHAGNADLLYGFSTTQNNAAAEADGEPGKRTRLTNGVASAADGAHGSTFAVVKFPEPERFVTSIVIAAPTAAGLSGAVIQKRKAGVWSNIVASQTYSTANALVTVAVNDTVEMISIGKPATSIQVNEFRPIY